MAKLRAKAHLIRKGHVVRIEELREMTSKLSPQERRRAASQLIACYKELKMETRLERLDKGVAENERRVRGLTSQAQADLQAHEYRRVTDHLDAASKLQAHNARLLRAIERTEVRLGRIAKKLAGEFSVGEA